MSAKEAAIQAAQAVCGVKQAAEWWPTWLSGKTPAPANVSMPVRPQLPSLNTPQQTNAGIRGWLQANYSGSFSGFGVNRKNFYQQIHEHINPAKKPVGGFAALFNNQSKQPDLTPEYTQFLNNKQTDLMKRVGVPYEEAKGPDGGPPPVDLLSSSVNVLPDGQRTLTLGGGEYAGQNYFPPDTPDAAQHGLSRDLYTWGPAMPRSLVALHERQHLLQKLPTANQEAAAGFKPVDYISSFDIRPPNAFMEPAAVLTEMAHAADAAKQVTGKPVPGDMHFTPRYSMPIDEIRREAARAGVLSGDHTAQEALNTPAGQAWLRMQMQEYADNPAREKRNSDKLHGVGHLAGGGNTNTVNETTPAAPHPQSPQGMLESLPQPTPPPANPPPIGPNTTLGTQISRWYQNTGGLDRAIAGAQAAQARRDTSVLNNKVWPTWTPDQVTQSAPPISMMSEFEQNISDNDGYWSPVFNEIKIDPTADPNERNALVEHELTHPALLQNLQTSRDTRSQPEWNPAELAQIKPGYPSPGTAEYKQYLAHPTEIDVRLAEIKRRYAHYTGELVETPEQAEQAWNWWKRNQRRFRGPLVEYAPDGEELRELSPAKKQQEFLNAGGDAVTAAGIRPTTPNGNGDTDFPDFSNTADDIDYSSGLRRWWLRKHDRDQLPTNSGDMPTLTPDAFNFYDHLPDDKKQQLLHRMPELVQKQQNPAFKQAWWNTNTPASLAARNSARQIGMRVKRADLLPDVQLQEHQQRVADKIVGEDPRLLVYHGLGSGKSLSALAAAEAAQKLYGGNYGVVVPASLRGNFKKEIKKFTRGSNPEVMSYTGLGMGKQFQDQPETLIMDEAARLRNPGSAMTRAAMRQARDAERLLLLTGTPITNAPTDLAPLISMLTNKYVDPKEFEDRYVGYKQVRPGLFGWLRGVKPGIKPYVKNEKELRRLLEGKIDYQASKTPEGVNVNEQIVRVPLSKEQSKIQHAIRTKIPPGFLWKLDREFPLSKDELRRLNGFLTGLRQVGLSTQPFRADKDPLKAFDQSAKLQTAFKNLAQTFESDPRKKALIYSNFVDAGLGPYAAGLARANIPHAFFHGSISPKARQAAVDAYNAGKLRALLIGPAGAEGISTKGTSLIQLLDPHWNEARTQQAQGRGLRFDSHKDLPEELKNVAVQRYLNQSEEPGWFGRKFLGRKRERTADEVLERLTAEKEQLNESFRTLLRDIGSRK